MTEQVTPPSTPPEHPEELGIAGRTAQAFIHSPLSLLLFFAMLGMGFLGLMLTPRQEDPQISVPIVDIFVQYPGTSSEQVASLAIDPLQRMMSEIPGIKHVYSASQHEQGIVTVQFKVGEDLSDSIVKVHDKLQSNMDRMPPGVSPPLVRPKGIDDVPVVNLTLWGDDIDDAALRTLALDVMHNIKEVPNTGQSFIVGGRTEQVRVEVMPERLSGFNLSLAQIVQTIKTANSEHKAGFIENNDTHFTVYTGNFLQSAEDVARLIIGTHQNTPIYVRDIAKVTQAPAEAQQLVNYFSGAAYHLKDKSSGHIAENTEDENQDKPAVNIEGMPAVTIAIAKKINTNGVQVANAILDHVEGLKGRIIPDNVHVEVTRNYGKTANDKVWSLIFKLFIATGAVSLLVLLWLGMRPAVVVTLVIPVVILITVFSAWILGFTIDRVSLFALIFSIGILVDDAIVVIENIYRRWLQKGTTDTETAIDAVREVGNPTILATFTVVAALLPMGFVSGMMGPYMAPIPALGSVAMVFSLLAAFIFTPWFAMRLKPSLARLQKDEDKEHRTNQWWEKFYRKILPPLINSKVKGYGFLFLLIAGFFAACSLFYVQYVEVKMMPLDNKPEFNVFIDMPEGTALPTTANTTYHVAEVLREIPEVVALQTYVGTSQPFDFNGMVRHYYLRNRPWHADIHVQLTEKADRTRSSHQIATEARRLLRESLGADSTVKTTVVEMPPGPPVLQSIVAEVYGPDDATRREVAQHLTKVFDQAAIIDDVDNYMAEPYQVWRFNVNTEKAIRRGISVDTINQNLSMALGGFKVGDIKKGTVLEPTYIVIRIPLAVRSQLSRLYDLPIPTNTGQTVPLAELGEFIQVEQDPIIYQKDLRRMEYVVGDSVGVHQGNNEYSLSAPIYGMFEVEDRLAEEDYTTPDGVKLTGGTYFGVPASTGQSAFEWTGEWTVTFETFRDMGAAFMVALFLIYVLVVWLFGNFITPMVIMAPIPLTLLGIIPAHGLLNASFTATSMIGWIALAGIIVRNSILLVDYSIHEIQKGTKIEDAVILACKTRTRPILITAFALMAGSFVILFDPIFQGMAISLMAGVFVSTLLTLVVIPLGCISVGAEALCRGRGNNYIPPKEEEEEKVQEYKAPLWFRVWTVLFTVLETTFYLIRAVFIIIMSLVKGLINKFKSKPKPPSPPPAASSTPSSGSPSPSPAPAGEAKTLPQKTPAEKTDDTSIETKPEETKPEEPKPVESKPVESKPVESKPEEPKPVKSKPVEPKPVESKPEEPKPEESKPEESKPVESKPVEPKPVEPKSEESKPAEPKPVEPKPVEPKPVEPKPVEPKPVEPKLVEPKPVEPKPVESKPVESKPVELKPVESKPEEPKPVESKPVESVPVEPTPVKSGTTKQSPPAKKAKPATKPATKARRSTRRGIRLKKPQDGNDSGDKEN